ncbi:Rne/Rng family ribonuclease [Cumulibacter soli]|uniref:Rne/Rng family ribonuclease n=1 Tax=Cumulibacter soli TaxID=2546344 RepID=UPI0010686DFA|nr:Rne/Rng family ribonuclease [Cumulibacter soli]
MREREDEPDSTAPDQSADLPDATDAAQADAETAADLTDDPQQSNDGGPEQVAPPESEESEESTSSGNATGDGASANQELAQQSATDVEIVPVEEEFPILAPSVETDVQPFVTSLAPQLSHVDTGSSDVEVTPRASFNPFALFQAPEEVVRPPRAEPSADEEDDEDDGEASGDDGTSDTDDDSSSRRRRRGRRGRGRRKEDGDEGTNDTDDASSAPEKDEAAGSGKSNGKGSADADDAKNAGKDAEKSAKDVEKSGKDTDKGGKDEADSDDSADENESGSRRRRRRRRRGSDSDGSSGSTSSDSSADKVQGVSGSVRLEAKRQRRKEGRDHGRRRAPILTEAEFLARRESVTREMVVRQQGERTQIAVLEDDVLVEHYVTLASEQSFAGGVYLGRVQNVLPSMEAAFIDIGKRRNAVLYAGEVNWDKAGLEGKQRNIEQALKSGDKVLVQVTKDPIGHKGARLTSQISLPGRYLVYVPGGSMTGISRKLPEQERARLKEILRRIVPEDAGVIIRTAAEGASEEELNRDVQRLKAQWEVIEQKAAEDKTKAPSMLYEEPDLAIRVVRDLFNEDFAKMVVSGAQAWDTISSYIQHVAPDLVDRISQSESQQDVFKEHRIDEQLAKALDRKVWLPSGGSLVIDRTEAMTVIDVNTGKFTGSGGNLEQTVTKNNLEAAEEIVRQLRLRDVGGIVVIDFIDMLLESNRELVLRRLTECLGRDRTKHQVAEVTSLGLVQMTRKRVGQGLIDAFSEPCPHCDGRGIIVHEEPIEKKTASTGSEPTSRRGSRSRRGGRDTQIATAPKEEPRRDSTPQLSAIAAASQKDETPAAPEADADSVFETFSVPDEPATTVSLAPSAPVSEAGASDTVGEQRKPTETAADRLKTDAPVAAEQSEVAPKTNDEPIARPVRTRRRAARRPAGPPTSSA